MSDLSVSLIFMGLMFGVLFFAMLAGYIAHKLEEAFKNHRHSD